MKLYKLTDENGRTRNNTQWGEGVSHVAKEGRPVLCSPTVIHAYTSPGLAMMMNPIHGGFTRPRMWEAAGKIVTGDGTNSGVKSLTTTRETLVPSVKTEQRLEFARRCALAVYPLWKARDKGGTWLAWAKGQGGSARDAAATAYTTAYAAAAADADARAARDAAYAAYAAARAAVVAADAAYVADDAAYAAAAARAAANTDIVIDLASIAESCLKGC